MRKESRLSSAQDAAGQGNRSGRATRIDGFCSTAPPTRDTTEDLRRILGGRGLREILSGLRASRLFLGAAPRARCRGPAAIQGCEEVFRQIHDFTEGWIVLSGQYRLDIDGKLSVMERGDCVILPPETCHAHYAHPRDAYAILGWASFPLSFAIYTTARGGRRTRTRRLGHHLIAKALLPEAAVVEQLPVRAQHWSSSRLATHAGQCLAMLFQAATTLLGEHSGWPGKRIESEDLRVAAMAELIGQRYYQALSLQQVCRSVGLSPAYGCHLFSRSKKMSPMAYLSKVRLDAAAKLLATTDLLVKQVAASAGYRDANYLTRRFRRAFGVTPLAYRASAAQGAPRTSQHG